MANPLTPGPWRYDYLPGYCGELIASNGRTVATFSDEPECADAQLIVAAPELLEALEEMLLQHGVRGGDGASAKARAAIAKATSNNQGKQQ
jgi:hypothetical protein